MTKPGIEQFMDDFDFYVGKKRIGLVTNPSAVDSNLCSTLDRLAPTGQLTALFGLEHGVRGNIQAGEQIQTAIDKPTGLPVFSLYGQNRRPTAEMLRDIDCLVFDLQDVGCRFYTYLYSLLYLLEAAAEHQLPIFVLDRPNPLGGSIVHGNLLEEDYISFVGYPLPIRYGLTIGEVAQYFNETRKIGADLTVVKMEGWRRDYTWKETNLSWIPPSPNIPTPDTALVYPGTCLFEGTNLSEGRGTTRPFELLGAPWIDAPALSAKLNDLNLAGVRFRPAYFTPMFSKFKDELCAGVQIHVLDPSVFCPVTTGLQLVWTIATSYSEFEFLTPPGQRYFFDLLAGTKKLRQCILTEDQSAFQTLNKQWEQEAAFFAKSRETFLLYE